MVYCRVIVGKMRETVRRTLGSLGQFTVGLLALLLVERGSSDSDAPIRHLELIHQKSTVSLLDKFFLLLVNHRLLVEQIFSGRILLLLELHLELKILLSVDTFD